MRHGDAHRRFNMPKSQRRALFSNLTNALLTHEQITITLPRAKELRTFADNMITYAKKGDLNSRRQSDCHSKTDKKNYTRRNFDE